MGKSRVTTIDLARAAGVSKMTVSRALRGERGIAAATRQRILKLADTMGYRPDPAVSELMGHLHKSASADLEVLAWVTTYTTIGGWRDNPGTCEIYRGAVAQAHKLGYRLEEFSLNTPGMTPRRLSNILYNQGIRGIVLAPLFQHGTIENFSWEHFATACCSHSLRSPKQHRVSVDQFVVFRTAWAHLQACGYERIGFCVPANDNNRFGRRWESAYLLENQTVPRKNRVPPMITDDWTPQTFLRWYERYKPDVILSRIEVYDWITQSGINVPKDCGFSLIRLDQAENIAGMDHHFADIGAATVSLVVSDLHTNQYGIPAIRKSVSIETHWQHGPTIRPEITDPRKEWIIQESGS